MTKQVNVINSTMSGRFFIEGTATVIKEYGDDIALVDFGDDMPVERFVDPLAQGKDVAKYVARLNDPNCTQ